MQHEYRNGDAASVSNVTHVLSSTPGRVLLREEHAGIPFFVRSNQTFSGVSMKHVSDSWNCASFLFPSLGLSRNGTLGTSPPLGSQQSQQTPHKNCEVKQDGGFSALEEHDYIGLSCDSSPSVRGGSLDANFAGQKCIQVIPDLDSKETELRLGLGPRDYANQESAGAIDVKAPGKGEASSEVTSDKNVILASADTDERRLHDKPYGGSDGFSRPHIHQEAFHIRNREIPIDPGNGCSRLFSSRDLIAGAKLADQDMSVGKGITENETQGLETTFCLKRQTCPSQRINLQPSEKSSRGETFKEACCSEGCMDYALLSKLCSGQVDVPLAQQYPCSDAEKYSFDSALTSQRGWQAHISRPWKGVPDISQPNFLERDVSKTPVQGNAGGFAGARSLVPVPKYIVPTKRGFQEALGLASESPTPMEKRTGSMDLPIVVGPGSSSASSQRGISPGNLVVTSMETSSHQSPSSSISFLWNNPVGSWQTVPDPRSKIQGCPILLKPHRGPMIASQSKVAAGNLHENEATGSSRQTSKDEQDASNMDNEGSPSLRVPVVGWPPVRAFRKNTLAVGSHKNNLEDQQPVVTCSPECPPLSSSSFFVKANMDGVPIGRKIDLKAYDSYEGLKLALQDMFQRFINGSNGANDIKELNLLRGTEYVLTHEDKDGDWMLVGDVPWEMFVSTVKRLRIMKSSQGIHLGQSPKSVGVKS